MLLVDNITILKNVYPLTYEKIKEIEYRLDNDLAKIEPAKNGQKTLAIKKDDKLVYMHSKYNPIRESEPIIDQYTDIEEESSVIFYGVGLGYHIDAFLKKHPDVNFYIYEPIPEILYAYLSNKEIKALPTKRLKNIITGSEKKDIVSFLSEFIDKSAGKTTIVNLPIHSQIFPEKYRAFLEAFKEVAESKKSGIVAEYTFQKRWTINSMKNLKEVLSTPNILLEKKGQFKGKPALLVGAGPSLNEEIENIRYIKENGLAYIFSVGSAINTLLYHNIYPDATCTYDPKKTNKGVFHKIINMNIKEIPLIFGSSVGYETLENYLGKKIHMITSQDTVARFYLKTRENENIECVYDAPSIAIVTLQLLNLLGFGPIILAGQNLAFKDRSRHSEGIEYSKAVTESELKNGICVQDVYGNKVLTDDGYNRMREQIEFYIKEFNILNVINTTKGGAHIEGTSFIELIEVIERDLKDKVVDEHWLDCDKTEYDKEYMLFQSKKMDKERKEALKLVKEFYGILDSISIFIKNRNYNQAEKMYVKLDNVLSKIEKNKFFQTFILPMNRVSYKRLVDSIDGLNEEKDKLLRAQRVISNFKEFMDTCKTDIDYIKPILSEMNESIMSHCNKV